MRITNRIAIEFLAELLGSFILLTLALGSVAQFKLSKQDNPYAYSSISASFGNGLAVTCAVTVVGNISGWF